MLESHADSGPQGVRDAAQHAQRVAFVAGGLEAADLLLGSLQFSGQFLLGKAGFLS